MRRLDIERAVALGGLPAPFGRPNALDGVMFEVAGQEPILNSPHHLATGAAACRVLTGVGADALWSVRTGRSQSLQVDARHAAAALRSFLSTEPRDPSNRPSPDLRDEATTQLTRILSDGTGRYVQLHGSFHDGPAVLSLLGLGPGAAPEAVAGAVAIADGRTLESALIEAGLCGSVVRSRSQWARHPQGRAIASLPVVEVVQIGDAPPEPLPDGPLPASGVRVLDVTRVLAGPTCAKVWAEHGADVLHVTSPRARPIPRFDLDTGVGKRQASLDPDDPTDVAALVDLAAHCDVFSQGFRPGELARRGLGPRQLAALRPGIVYVEESCYGPVGPWAQRPGWEQLAQAATGMSFREGAARGAQPTLAPAAVNDYSTGWLAAYGAMVALVNRARVGGSWAVRCSLTQTAMWYQRLGHDLDPAAAAPIDVDAFLTTVDSEHYGAVTTLAPALAMSETEPRFARGPAPPGAHAPEWLAR